METPKTIFQNNEEVAHAVSDYLQRTDSTFKTTFSVRPYNRFSPTFSEWWFIPREGGWPAYHCSKLSFRIVHPHDEYSTCLFAGFYVEKGLGQVVSNLPDVKRNLIMQDNWYWFRFLRYMENGDFDDAIRRVQEYSQSPVHLGMEAYPFNKVPDPDKERPSSQDSLDFLVSTPNIKLEIFKPAKGVLSEFKECSDLRALAEKLNFSADVHYFWIDLHLGVYLQYGTKETGHWESRQIWRNSLEPWIEWIE